MRLLVAALLAASALAGCGGGSSSSTSGHHGYPKTAEDTFIKACTAQGAKSGYCHCALDRIEGTVPYPEFKKADQALGSLRGAAKDTRGKFLAAIKACGGKTAG
jgi:hypothetical protein